MASTNSSARLQQSDDNRGVSLYLRVANALRAEILGGRWPAGHRLPTIPELTRQFGVGTITVRQAFQLLSEEGLIQSYRGRGTFVQEGVRAGTRNQHLRTVISDPLGSHPDLRIKVLSRRDSETLPEELQGRHRDDGPYKWIRKVHYYSGVPFALMDIFVTRECYQRFPRNADAKFTVPRLISDHGKVEMVVNDLEVSVRFADEETARLLGYSTAGALARLLRWRTDRHDNVIMGSINLFRADMFVLDIAETGRPFHIESIRPTGAKRA